MKKIILYKQNRIKYQGFTLIELLVVISIITLLVSILLPSLRHAKQQARRIVCASGLKNISLSLILYANDCDGQLPNKGNAAYPQSVLYFGEQQFEKTEYFPNYITEYQTWYCPERDLAEKMNLKERWKMGELYYLYTPTLLKHYGSFNVFNAQSSDILACDTIGDYTSLFIANHTKDRGGRYANIEDVLGSNIAQIDGSVVWKKFDDLTPRIIGPFIFWW